MGAAALVTGVPLAAYLLAPAFRKTAGKWVNLGTTGDFPPGHMRMMPFEFQIKDGWQVLPQRGFVWVKIDGPGRLKVFSSRCTHLACNVVWQEKRQIFVCPCHAGYFDAEGKNISGPPTRPLTVLEHRIDNGNLLTFLPI